MERRLFWWFCLLTALGSVESADEPKKKGIYIEKSNNTLMCDTGSLGYESISLTDDGSSGTYTCESEECSTINDDCPKAVVKIRSSENMIQLETPALVTVLVSNFLVTGMIGWAVYSVCAQPRTRSSYQGNKASDRQNLISNNAAGDTYQPLNARASEYSTLHGARKPKNSKHPLSP